MKRLVRQAIIALSLTCVLGAQTPPAPKRPAARKAKPAAGRSVVEGPPFQLDGLIKLATAKGSNGKPLVEETQMVEAVRNRKLAFEATEENVKRLETAGVPEAVIAAVREVAPVTAPPEPPKPTSGVLALSCAPKECSVQVDSAAAEQTKGGVLRKTLPLGKHVVDIMREGFATERRTIEITVEGARVDVSLKADAATRRKYGYAVLDRMLQAIGDENATIHGQGSYSVSKGALPDEWSIVVQFAGPNAKLAVRGGAGVYQIECAGERCESKKPTLFKGKEVKDASRIENELRAFRRYNLARVISEIKARRATSLQPNADSDLPVHDGRYLLRVEGADEAYEITLDPAYLPRTMTYTLKLGAAPIQLSFNDYKDLGKIRYPKETILKVNSAGVGLIQVRLDQFSPSLK